MPDHRRLAILIRHRKAAHVTPAQMACACGLEGSRAYESVSAWERGEARGDVGRSDAAPVQGVAARREGRAARGVRGKRGARREARGKRGARREARGATIRCRVAGRPALVASFLSPRSARLTPLRGLNPLHCGAVVASRARREGARREARGGRGVRGEGRDAAIRCTVVGCPVLGAAFLLPRSALLTPRCGLNPLHCGAVVASPEEVTPRDAIWAVLIPFIAGQWSLPAAWDAAEVGFKGVLIPFIAGQWSLLSGSWQRSKAMRSLNPLHCGAVVASQWRRGAAAPRPTRAQPRCAPIIIPFIAGQWSLPGAVWRPVVHPLPASQSPSLRGSGRFKGGSREE